MKFTIGTARRVQQGLGLLGSHVAHVEDDGGFVLAHAQAERDAAADLEACEIHLWLAGAYVDCCFPEPGWYEIFGLHDVKGIPL